MAVTILEKTTIEKDISLPSLIIKIMMSLSSSLNLRNAGGIDNLGGGFIFNFLSSSIEESWNKKNLIWWVLFFKIELRISLDILVAVYNPSIRNIGLSVIIIIFFYININTK
jgi:hypothetical protein